MFGGEEVDVADCIGHFKSQLPGLATPTLLLYDVIYAHAIGIYNILLVLYVYMYCDCSIV